MARNVTIKVLRTTRANLNSQASGNGLLAGEPYLITDEGRFALGLTTSSYAEFAKRDASDLTAGTLAVARLPAFTGGDVTSTAGSGNLAISTSVLTTFGRSLTSASTAAIARTALGLGSAAIENATKFGLTFADRTSLSAVYSLTSAYLRESGREGMFVFTTSDISAGVTADPGQGVYVASSIDSSGVSGGWIRVWDWSLNVKWFGAVGDGTTDDSTAFTRAIAFLKFTATNTSSFYKASGRLYVPSGHFYLGTTTLDVTHTLLMEGDGSGFAGTVFPSRLRWAANATGIRVQRYNTSGASTYDGASTHFAGDGSRFTGLWLTGGYSTTEGEYHGFHLKARAHIERCAIGNFQGDGVYCVATAGSADANEGNANCGRLWGTVMSGNRNGLYISGADVNIWSIQGCDFSGNRRWGAYDVSFLGNTYSGCHADANGLVSGSTPTVVTYSGNRYAVVKDQGAGASTNAPSGTTADNAYWYYIGAGAASAPNNIATWSSGTTYRDGGSYRSEGGGNAGNLFSGCYHETGQGPAQLTTPALVVGGSMHPNVKGVAVLYGNANGIASSKNVYGVNGQFSGNDHVLGTDTGADAALSFRVGSGATQSGIYHYRAGAADGYYINVLGVGYLNGVNGVKIRANGVNVVEVFNNGTITGLNMNSGILWGAASTTGLASLRIPHGVAPTTPTDGDVWTTTAGMYVRVNGATVGPLGTGGGGGGGYTLTTQSGAHSPSATSGEVVVLASSAAGGQTITLPTAVGNTAKITVKKTGVAGSDVTIATTSSQTIDGGTTATLTKQYEAITLVSDNANWWII